MTREAVSAAKPAVRVQAKTGKVHGAASAAVLKGLVYGAAMLTFAVLLFLLGYILVTGIPHLKPSLFQWNYTSENVSMMPAILATVETTALALLLAMPLGLFTAVYLNEYAKRGNKLVNVIRITTETLSGHSVHRIRLVRHAVLRHQAALGILAAGRCDDAGDHDPAAHHAYR